MSSSLRPIPTRVLPGAASGSFPNPPTPNIRGLQARGAPGPCAESNPWVSRAEMGKAFRWSCDPLLGWEPGCTPQGPRFPLTQHGLWAGSEPIYASPGPCHPFLQPQLSLQEPQTPVHMPHATRLLKACWASAHVSLTCHQPPVSNGDIALPHPAPPRGCWFKHWTHEGGDQGEKQLAPLSVLGLLSLGGPLAGFQGRQDRPQPLTQG